LLGAAEIRQLAESMNLRPTKKLGQNFVIDPNTIRKIVTAANLAKGDVVVEIGPGLGSLTLGILEKVDRVIAVEIDERLAKLLPFTISAHAPGKKLEIVREDAMRVEKLPGEPNALVANLPYNISVPVLIHFLESFPSIRKMLVMVQAEVATRLAATPGGKDYGSPSAKLAWFGNARHAGNIGRNVFWPAPQVDSALVYFERAREEKNPAVFRVIDAAFSMRRKTLRQALAGWAGSPARAEEILLRAGIDPRSRGEQLGIEDFVRVASSQ
jgi:16S rRNA (adenine1518-N6/adenine1519-N6)-dimethyltransferase